MICADKVYPDEAVYPTNCCNCKIVFHSYCFEHKNSYTEYKIPLYKKQGETYEEVIETVYKKIEGHYNCNICGHKIITATKPRVPENF